MCVSHEGKANRILELPTLCIWRLENTNTNENTNTSTKVQPTFLPLRNRNFKTHANANTNTNVSKKLLPPFLPPEHEYQYKRNIFLKRIDE